MSSKLWIVDDSAFDLVLVRVPIEVAVGDRITLDSVYDSDYPGIHGLQEFTVRRALWRDKTEMIAVATRGSGHGGAVKRKKEGEQ